MDFIGKERASAPTGIPFANEEYLALVNWTGKAIRDEKMAHIPPEIEPILERLNLDQAQWVSNVKYFESRFPRVVGALEIIYNYTQQIKACWVRGQSAVRQLYRMLPT